MLMVIATFLSTAYYLFKVYEYFNDYYNTLDIKQKLIEPKDQGSFLYYAITDDTFIWLVVLFLIDIFATIMVVVLLYFQFKFMTLGYTQQFQQPTFFVATSKHMKTWRSALAHRLDNIYTFFFESFEANEALYYRQQKEYSLNTSLNKPIPMGDYPKATTESIDNQFINSYSMVNNVLPSIGNVVTNGSSIVTNSAKKYHEINLD
jgi:hypothetical protein